MCHCLSLSCHGSVSLNLGVFSTLGFVHVQSVFLWWDGGVGVVLLHFPVCG